MRTFTRFLPALLLGSTLGACSMAGTGDYFADEYAHMQRQQLPQIHGTSVGCGYVACTPQHSYPVAQAGYQTPDQHAYGQSVQAHPGYGAAAYTAPTYGAPHGLRQSYSYGSLGATMYDVDSDLFGVQARLGWQSASFLGAELEGSLGLTEETDTVAIGADTLQLEQKIDYQIAAFGIARVPVSPTVNVLGRVGYHNTLFATDFENTTTGVEFENENIENGFAYGLGAELAVGPRTSVRADYTRYDFGGPDSDTISLAIARKF